VYTNRNHKQIPLAYLGTHRNKHTGLGRAFDQLTPTNSSFSAQITRNTRPLQLSMFENKETTNISELGEFGLIEHLTKQFIITKPETKLSIGDDAAVIHMADKQQVISTDMLIEDIHFDMMYSPLVHIGYKSISSSISDICAMNAKASQVLVSVAMSSKYTLQAVEELYTGIRAACEKYDVELIGGDTSSSVIGMCISVTVIGYVEEKKIVTRSGAKEGDLLCVSGDLGGAYMGLQILEREKQVFLTNKEMKPDLEGKDYIVGRQLRPEARKDIVDLFEELGIQPSSMIDVSDGLSSEVFHLCKQSNIGMKIYEDKLPIDQQTYDTAIEFNLAPTTCAMNGGEDYELLFTVPQADFDKIKNSMDISIVGYCTAPHEGKELITKSGNVVPLEAQGWENFNLSVSKEETSEES
jgi:thiamine-monophosphate kinase|tara:strand:- start:9456 stop:10688 length:1233 start_codon:yes stop_codon:yes gene_type:complete